LGSFERALDYYRSVMKLFDTFEHDQFDFHHYALRRQAIHAYTRFIEYVDNIKTNNFYLLAVNEGSLCLRAMLKRENQRSTLQDDKVVECFNLAISLLKASPPNTETLLMCASIFESLSKPILLLKTLKQLRKLDPENPELKSIISNVKFDQGEFSALLTEMDIQPSTSNNSSLMDFVCYHFDIPEQALESVTRLPVTYKEKFKLAMALSDIKHVRPMIAHKIDEFINNKLLIG
jgi:tetratricopeptide (TPR) repeat protein